MHAVSSLGCDGRRLLASGGQSVDRIRRRRVDCHFGGLLRKNASSFSQHRDTADRQVAAVRSINRTWLSVSVAEGRIRCERTACARCHMQAPRSSLRRLACTTLGLAVEINEITFQIAVRKCLTDVQAPVSFPVEH